MSCNEFALDHTVAMCTGSALEASQFGVDNTHTR